MMRIAAPQTHAVAQLKPLVVGQGDLLVVPVGVGGEFRGASKVL